jgi:hypothetical protein
MQDEEEALYLLLFRFDSSTTTKRMLLLLEWLVRILSHRSLDRLKYCCVSELCFNHNSRPGYTLREGRSEEQDKQETCIVCKAKSIVTVPWTRGENLQSAYVAGLRHVARASSRVEDASQIHQARPPFL